MWGGGGEACCLQARRGYRRREDKDSQARWVGGQWEAVPRVQRECGCVGTMRTVGVIENHKRWMKRPVKAERQLVCCGLASLAIAMPAHRLTMACAAALPAHPIAATTALALTSSRPTLRATAIYSRRTNHVRLPLPDATTPTTTRTKALPSRTGMKGHTTQRLPPRTPRPPTYIVNMT